MELKLNNLLNYNPWLTWDNAMDEKMATLDVNVTWKLVALSKDKKAIGCKWLYKVA
jgi:hypothetical protein